MLYNPLYNPVNHIAKAKKKCVYGHPTDPNLYRQTYQVFFLSPTPSDVTFKCNSRNILSIHPRFSHLHVPCHESQD